MEYTNQIVALTSAFYANYPPAAYPEILTKAGRPYNCLLVETHYNFYICLPFRTNIQHKYAYRFKHSLRSQKNKSGIDYSKMVIINDDRYISSGTCVIDQDEYRKAMQHLNIIVHDALCYLDNYIHYIHGTSSITAQEFQRRYGRSTLPYFHAQLLL